MQRGPGAPESSRPEDDIWLTDRAQNFLFEFNKEGTILNIARNVGVEGASKWAFKQPDAITIDREGDVRVRSSS